MSPRATRQLAHVWDASACINCGACAVACTMTNYVSLAHAGAQTERGMASNIVRRVDESGPMPKLLLMQCQQCADAPCAKRCPEKAISRTADGMVVTDESKCIQCGRCVKACPYGARWTDPVSETPKSCMGPGCRALVAAGQQPACVQACPVQARDFGDVRDPGSPVARRIAAAGKRRRNLDRGTKPQFFVLDKA